MSLKKVAQSDLLRVSTGIILKMVYTLVFVAGRSFLNQKQNLMQAVVGLVFMKLPATIKLMN